MWHGWEKRLGCGPFLCASSLKRGVQRVCVELWKLQWLLAEKRSVLSSVHKQRKDVPVQNRQRLKHDLRSLLDFKNVSGRKKPRRKDRVPLERRKSLTYRRQPSQHYLLEFTPESNLLKKSQERSGESESPTTYGRLDDNSRKVNSTWNAGTHHSPKNGKKDFEKSYSAWRTVASPKGKTSSCTRRRSLDGNFVQVENLKVSTSPWNKPMESGWSGKARKSKEKANQSTTSIVFQLEEERWKRLRSSGSSTRHWGHYPRIRVCAQFVGLRATGKLDVPSRTWLSNYGNRLWQCWFQLIDCVSTTLAGISYANCTSMSHRTQLMAKNVSRICRRRHRSVQKPNLLRRVPVSVPNQSKGELPTYVALGLLLVILLLQLTLNCAKFGHHCIRKTRKSALSCTCMRRKVNRMHSIRWRRRVSHWKRSMKLFVFTLLIVRTEAMEAAGSPGSIGADVPPVAGVDSSLLGV